MIQSLGSHPLLISPHFIKCQTILIVGTTCSIIWSLIPKLGDRPFNDLNSTMSRSHLTCTFNHQMALLVTMTTTTFYALLSKVTNVWSSNVHETAHRENIWLEHPFRVLITLIIPSSIILEGHLVMLTMIHSILKRWNISKLTLVAFLFWGPFILKAQHYISFSPCIPKESWDLQNVWWQQFQNI